MGRLSPAWCKVLILPNVLAPDRPRHHQLVSLASIMGLEMPRYHFTLTDGETFLDPDGEELAHVEAAHAEASKYLAEMLKHKQSEVWKEGGMCVAISDNLGVEVARLTLAAVDPRLKLTLAPSLVIDVLG